MATAFGKIDEYQTGQDWTEYVERLEFYFLANDIGKEKDTDLLKRKSILLTVCGSQTYSLIRNLCMPQTPGHQSYEELNELVKNHLRPKPIIIAERFKYHLQRQKEGETVGDFLAELKKLSEPCEFGAFLNEALRDRFVCGLRATAIQKKLLAERDLTLQRAYEIAAGMEAADKQSAELRQVAEVTSKVQKMKMYDRKQSIGTECFRCGKSGHAPDRCFYRNVKCHSCQQEGHLSRKCPQKSKETAKPSDEKAIHDKKTGAGSGKMKKKTAKVKHLQETEETADSDSADEDDESGSWPLFSLKTSGHREILIPLQIEDQDMVMELDTGSCRSVISEKVYREKFSHLTLKKTNAMLTTYTGHAVPVLGELIVTVKNDTDKKKLPLVVCGGQGPPLLGRDWLFEMKLNWHQLKRLHAPSDTIPDDIQSKYASLFDGTLGTVKGVTAKLKVKEGATEKFYKPRPVAYALKDKVGEELDRLAGIGVVEKVSYSDWAAPIVPVLKPNGSVRICGDYKVTINPALEVQQYPLPTAQDLFTKLNGGQKFTKLDLSTAYQQVELDEASRDYVCINTHKGIYRYTRLPFGVACAPAIFQETMDKILEGLPVGCILDDIIITGKDDDEHNRNLDNTLKRLDDYGIKLNAKKCAFKQDSVEYFAYIVSADGVRPSEKKVQAIVEVEPPENVRELKSFLGLVNYYRKFLPNMSSVCVPLNELLMKGVHWNWTSECDHAFKQLKEMLTSSKVLAHYDSEKPLVLATDASPYGLGAVISHLDGKNERPIAFASRSLSKSEKNYSQIEKEGLAIMFGLEKFYLYLCGRQFTLYTDHKPLMHIFNPSRGIPVQTASRLQRWAIQLSAFNYDIKYRSGKQNENADALSRLPLKEEELKGDLFSLKEMEKLLHIQVSHLPVFTANIRAATQHDVLLSRVVHYTINGWPGETQVTPELVPFYRVRDELTTEEGCLLRGIRVIIPNKYQATVLAELHQNHPGIVRMKALARMHVWWPTLDTDIDGHVRSCHACQTHQSKPAKATGNPWIWPQKPWQRIHVDFAGPFLGEMFLIVVDAQSKWMEVLTMSSTTAGSTINALRYLFSRFGLPQELVSDNGPQFVSSEFHAFLSKNGVKHFKSSPYHPSSNGEAERAVRTFKEVMKTMKSEPGSLNQKLASFLLSYRTTPHSTTHSTPAELMFGRNLRTRIDVLKPDLHNRVTKRASALSTTSKEPRELSVGDHVLVRDYRQSKETWMNGVIVKKLGPVTYQVQVDDLLWKRHIDQLILCTADPPTRDNVEPVDQEVYKVPTVSLPSFLKSTGTKQTNANQATAIGSSEPTAGQTPTKPVPTFPKPVHSSAHSPENRYPQRASKKPQRLIENM